MVDFITLRRPVIASWTRPVGDYFDLQYFHSGEPEDLARAILKLYRDPGRRDRIVRRASELHQHYCWPVQRSIYLAAVHRLVTQDSDRTAKPSA